MQLAALDLGSNSFHLLVAHVGPAGAITKLASHKEVLKLGRVVQATGCLPEPEYAAALDAVAKLTSIARAFRVERLVVAATSALRDAANGREFCGEVERRFGVSVDLLSGAEEGRVVYGGARSSFPGLGGRVGVVDIGGGSVEVCLGEGNNCHHVASLPLGFLKVATKLEGASSQADALRSLVHQETQELRERLRWQRPETWLFSGGTARAIGKLVVSGPAGISHGAIRRVAAELAQASPERLRALGVDAKRTDGIAAGALVLEALVESFSVNSLRVSAGGLREGLLLRELGRLKQAPETREARLECASLG